MRKILFLDHDGVICLPEQWGGRFSSKEKFDEFDPIALRALNEIIESTDCEIVISSDWRKYAPLEEMKALYKERGIRKEPIAYTPIKYSHFPHNRESEIMDWVSGNLSVEEECRWIVIDDMPLFRLGEHFVMTRDTEGLRFQKIKENIINYLNRKEYIMREIDEIYKDDTRGCPLKSDHLG